MKALYLITDGTFTKIGTTTNVRLKKVELQKGNGYQLRAIFFKELESHKQTKEYLHKLFQHVRFMKGWFKLSEKEIEIAITIAIRVKKDEKEGRSSFFKGGLSC